MALTLRSLRWEQSLSLSLSRRRRPHQSSGGVLALALHVTSEDSKKPAGSENSSPPPWRDVSDLAHPFVFSTVMATVSSEYPSLSPSTRSSPMSVVTFAAALTICNMIACVTIFSSLSSVIDVRPSDAESRLEMTEIVCLGLSRSPSVEEKSARPLAVCDATIASSTHLPASIVLLGISAEAKRTEAVAAAHSTLPMAPLDSQVACSHMRLSISVRSSTPASSPAIFC